MGLDLFNTTVESTYDGLLKTSDNDNITGIAKQITDGNGNNTPLWISTTRIGVGVAPAVGYDFTTNLGKFTTIDATTVNASFVGNLTGNADTATKWATARTITLIGDVSGSTSIDGSLNVSITAVVANDSHTHDTRYYTETEIDATLTNYQLLSEKGAALGYAPLDSGGKIAEAYLPDSIVGQVEYQGTWDASLNTPTLSTVTPPKGHYYIVSVAGTFDSIDYAVGDWIISDGIIWSKVDNTDAVTNFNGRLGAILPLSTDYDSFFYTKTLLDAGQLDTRYYTETEISNFFSGTTAITGYNKTNWDTAYGWGDHAGLYLGISAKATDSNLLDGLDSSDFARVKKGTVTLTQGSYVRVARVEGDALASAIRMTVTGTTGSVVMNGTFDINVNHSYDMMVKSQCGHYTTIYLQIISNANEDYDIYLKYTSGIGTTCTTYIEIFPLNSEVITILPTATAYTTATFEHIATAGEIKYGKYNSGVTNPIMRLGTGEVVTTTNAQGKLDSYYLRSDTSDTMNGSLTLSVSDSRLKGGDSAGRLVVSNSNTTSYMTFNGATNANPNEIGIITPTDTFFYNNGSERMRIDSSGRVVIGATSPVNSSYKMSVSNSNGGYVSNASGAGDASFYSTSSTIGWHFYGDNGTTNTFHVTNAGQGYFSGNVGIGTTSPSQKLHVSGNIYTTGYSQAANAVMKTYSSHAMFGSNSASVPIALGRDASILDLVIDTSGRVGINQTSPAHKLDLGGDMRIRDWTYFHDGANYLNAWGNTSSASYSGVGQAWALLSSYGGWHTQLLVDYDTGNVGIGTTSPSYKLDVAGTIKSTGGLIATDDSARYYNWSSQNTGNSGTIWKKIGTYYAGGQSSRIKIVGVGTSSYGGGTEAGKITILAQVNNNNLLEGTFYQENMAGQYGAVWFNSISATEHDIFYQVGSYSEYAFEVIISDGSFAKSSATVATPTYTRAAERTWNVNNNITAASTGNVGIGTTSPQAPLHVIAASSANDALLQEWSYTSGTQDQYSLMLKQTVTSGVVRYNFSMVNNNAAYNDVLVLDRGNVGIGTTLPSYKLDVAGTIRATGDVIAYSDVRVKENIETIPNALNSVKEMRGVLFNKIGEEKQSTGVIAQEIEKILPQVVSEDDNGMKSVAYGNIVGVLIEAIKESETKKDKQIADLKQQIDELKKIIKNGV